MAKQILFCDQCNKRFRTGSYDPQKSYTCSHCNSPLRPQSTPPSDAKGQTIEPADDVSPDPLVGQQIGPYRILSKLGEGGMGAVYKAQHVDLRRFSALKILPQRMVETSPKAVQRFMREARSAAVLDHPNIVRVHTVGEAEGRRFIDMQFVEGESVENRLKREGRLSVVEATQIVRDTATALAEAHGANIVHRDIKPGNILLSKKGTVKVADFGLAKDVEQDSLVTQQGKGGIGTPCYMSPEQCDGLDLDGRADIYSLGVTYFHLLTGDLPFKASSILTVMLKQKTEPPPDPRSFVPALPEAACAIIEKCLAKAPKDRYQTCEELLADLDRVPVDVAEPGPPQPAPVAGPSADISHRRAEAKTETAPTPPVLASRRHRWVVGAVGLAVVGIVAVIGYVGIRSREPRQTTDTAGQTTKGTKIAKGTARLETEGPRPKTAQQTTHVPRPSSLSTPEGLPRYEFWKRLGPTVPVPGPDGEIQQLPAGVLQDVEYSPDGKCLAVAHSFGVDLYDTQDWKILRRIDGHEAVITSIAFGPNGKKLATGSNDKTIRVWDVHSQEELLRLRAHHHTLYCVAFSSDGRRIAADDGKNVCLWDADTGQEACVLKGHTGCIFSLAFSPDDRYVASGSGDHTVRLWDAKTGTQLRVLEGHPGWVRTVAFSPDGRYLASGGAPERGRSDGMIRVWDVETGKELRVLAGHSYEVRALAFTPDGRRIVAGASKGMVRVWDAKTGAEIKTLKTATDGYVNSLTYHADGKHFASSAQCGLVQVWDAETGDEVRMLRGYAVEVLAVTFGPADQRLASGRPGGKTVCLWDVAAGTQIRAFEWGRSPALCVAFSPDGGRLASGHSLSGRINLWDVQTGRRWEGPAGHTDDLNSIAFSPDGGRLASASSDGTVRLWDADTGNGLLALKQHTDLVYSVAFAPDGRGLASGSRDQTIRLYDVESGRETLVLAGHTEAVRSVAFSPDGRRVASASHDRSVRLWDADTGAQLRMLTGHTGYAVSVAYASDGRHVVSASHDRTVRVWDADTGEAVSVMTAHRDRVNGVAFAPHGRLFASASDDGSICLWRRVEGPTTEDTKSTKEEPAPKTQLADTEIERMVAKIRTYFPTPAMKEAIRRFIEERRKPFKNARTITVRQDGRGDFTTIRAAADAAREGDIIEIGDDRPYSERVKVETRGLWLRAASGKSPVLAFGKDTVKGAAISAHADDVCLSGLEIAGWPEMGVMGYRGSGEGTEGFKGLTVVGNSFLSIGSAITARSCQDVVVACNVFMANSHIPISASYVPPAHQGPARIRAVCNLIIDSGLHGCYFSHAKWISVSHNVFWRPAENGVRFGNTSDGICLLANLFYQNRSPVAGFGKKQALRADWNVVWQCYGTHSGNERMTLRDWRQETGQGKHSLCADPKLVAPEQGDFRLRPDSPCRGAGPNGTDIGIPWDADADYFYKLLTTPIEQLIEDAKEAVRDADAAQASGTPQHQVFPHGPIGRGGKIIREKDGAEMVRIPAGEFTMGSEDGEPDERPPRKVFLDEYYIDKFEVTVAQFRKFCKEAGHRMPEPPEWNKEKHPVVNVSWEGAVAYAKWAGASLPTEAQWEKAARGTDGRKYPWGGGKEAPNEGGRYRCNYDPGDDAADGYQCTAPVGSFPKGVSPYGCMDMAGNMCEWCADRYDEGYYAESPNRNPTGPSSGERRVLRDGSWFLNVGAIRSSHRSGRPSSCREHHIGFRCSMASCDASTSPTQGTPSLLGKTGDLRLRQR